MLGGGLSSRGTREQSTIKKQSRRATEKLTGETDGKMDKARTRSGQVRTAADALGQKQRPEESGSGARERPSAATTHENRHIRGDAESDANPLVIHKRDRTQHDDAFPVILRSLGKNADSNGNLSGQGAYKTLIFWQK